MTDLSTIVVTVEDHHDEPSDLERAMRSLPESVLSNRLYIKKMKDVLKAMANLHPASEGSFIPVFESRCAHDSMSRLRAVGMGRLDSKLGASGRRCSRMQRLSGSLIVPCRSWVPLTVWFLRVLLPNSSTPEIAIVVRMLAPTSGSGYRPSAGFIGAVAVSAGVSHPFVTATLGTSGIEVQALVDTGCSADVVWPEIGTLNMADRHAFRDTEWIDRREYNLAHGMKVEKDVYR